MDEKQFMKLALDLAKQGIGYVSPNPMVGAVIVKDGQIISQGYHEKYGQLHAERLALMSCATSAQDATMYVTLEPCCHHGKTPPCTDAIVDSGIKKVVIGSTDPNPQVAGKGIQILRDNGVEVVEGVLKDQCDKLNEVFFHYIKTQEPFVVMKYAMTMDGKISTHLGLSKWITSQEARRQVHQDRHRYSAIMVGVGTVLADDPLLNCRIKNSKNPIRIICDSNLRTPLHSQIVKTAKQIKTIIATTVTDENRKQKYLNEGCQVITVNNHDGHLHLGELMKKLGNMEVDSILLEGGSTLNWSALQAQIVNKVQCYIAPKLFGGTGAKSPIGGIGIDEPDKAYTLVNSTIQKIGEDILIESDVVKNCLQE